jgi:hypothetical protein
MVDSIRAILGLIHESTIYSTSLFIGDEEGIRRSMARALRHERYKTCTAVNGEVGL